MTENDTLDVEAGLNRLGLVLPAPMKLGEGMRLPFPWVRMRGNRIYVSGHGPQNPDGTLAHPLGKVGKDVTPDQGYEAARLTALAVLGSLRRELGDLNRVTAWLRVHGMVNVAPPPGFNRTPAVINGFSDLILELWGPDRGAHARCAVGLAELPGDIPVEIEAEVAIERQAP
jgi:enamine deaminase RidA (YjgF/YER057c/UK114 family)